MKNLYFEFDGNSELTTNDLIMAKEFFQSMTATLIKGLGEEVIRYIEKAQDMCVLLFLSGCLFGEENQEITRMEIINRTQEFRSMARYLVKELQNSNLETFNTYDEIYTQVMIHGIYFGQKSALLDD